MDKGTRSRSGVFVADDFRSNLIIDRYDPDFVTMRGSKTDTMRSENSEDVLTWNVFRSLSKVDPGIWLTALFRRAFNCECLPAQSVAVRLWQRLQPPPTLRFHHGDEGESEIDVLIETERFVWVIEAKYRSDISDRTTNNAERDQVLRNIDVGSWHAGVRDFFFSLLVLDSRTCEKGSTVVQRYAASLDDVLRRLPHRTDGLTNLKGIGMLCWSDFATVLHEASRFAANEDERLLASRAVEWLRSKRIECVGTERG